MAHENIDVRRSMVGKVLSAGIRIGSREAKLLGVVFNCSSSAIQADAKIVHEFFRSKNGVGEISSK